MHSSSTLSNRDTMPKDLVPPKQTRALSLERFIVKDKEAPWELNASQPLALFT